MSCMRSGLGDTGLTDNNPTKLCINTENATSHHAKMGQGHNQT